MPSQASMNFAAKYVAEQAAQRAANAKIVEKKPWWVPKAWHEEIPNYTQPARSRSRSRQSRQSRQSRRNRSQSRKSRRNRH